MKMKPFILIILLNALSSQSLIAKDIPAGWKWYNEPQIKRQAPSKKVSAPPPNSTTTVMSATKQMQWFHEVFQEAVADATINPTDTQKNLKVMQLKHFISQKTSQTGMTFKKLLLENPEYSYIKDRPVEQAARSTYYAQERDAKGEAVEKMKAQGWGFFFVYQGEDALSQTLAPSVQAFADTHSMELLGISEDGVFIDAVKNNRNNDKKVVVPFTPALLLVNPKTGEFKPLAYGFISQNELLGRFYNVANDYQTPDF
ncbi:type-F conjugative transfer system pilin assembly protein TraF [Vibrio crassostreae]|uniref:type-F conjugative transfer system pilin assembly protein TraF n=1 Tax=Vibrio crassostreae TaxID=246167 RepID=UPI001B312BB7|nr:type-F conjugative transfer system pilin assembly protein TraF [Vibrio crassostreae]CAH6877133.1 IncF plasmid conjugative transfer pilus assembly protein TraF [Vibrio chagasii]